MDRHIIKKLADLYDRREQMQRSKEDIVKRKDFLEKEVENMGRGTGTNSSIISHLGGVGPFQAILRQAVIDNLENQMRHLDTQIKMLGGSVD